MDPLSPIKLRRLLAALAIASALVLDLVRGRPTKQLDVREIRHSIRDIREVLDALDEAQPWHLPPDPPEAT